MNIDWSKAPEGATHWGPEMDDYFAGWYKREAGVWFSALGSEGIWNLHDDDELPHTLIQRPAADPAPASWPGAGLPPAGTVCEALISHHPEPLWVEVTVLAHWTSPQGLIYSWVAEKDAFYPPDEFRFRPIRTPEQIAAEEREKAVEQMVTCIAENTTGIGMADAMICAKALYDAGFRKPEVHP